MQRIFKDRWRTLEVVWDLIYFSFSLWVSTNEVFAGIAFEPHFARLDPSLQDHKIH